jgi:hypothetical protein
LSKNYVINEVDDVSAAAISKMDTTGIYENSQQITTPKRRPNIKPISPLQVFKFPAPPKEPYKAAGGGVKCNEALQALQPVNHYTVKNSIGESDVYAAAAASHVTKFKPKLPPRNSEIDAQNRLSDVNYNPYDQNYALLSSSR